MRCPICKLINPNSALNCDCGYVFTEKEKELKSNRDTGNKNRFFSLEKLISGSLIRFIYILGVIITAIASSSVYLIPYYFPPIHFIFPIGVIVLIDLILFAIGNIIWRIICEKWILGFNIYDTLRSIEEKL